MTSLKEKLHTLIKEKGYLSYEDFVGVCLREGYKVSNGERRMRELCNEFPINPVMNKSKRGTEYISGWESNNKIKLTLTVNSVVNLINGMQAFKETKQQPLL